MTLFHKYYSRKLLFAADVLAALQGAPEHTLPRSALERLSIRYGMSPQLCTEVLQLLTSLELIVWQRETRRYHLETGWASTVPQLPPSAIEEDYLQWILRLPQATLFLPEALRRKLTDAEHLQDSSEHIQKLMPFGEQAQPSLSQPEFCCILEAISRGCAISYDYQTRDSKEPVRTTAAPWRLEYSAYDNRWWIILYTLDENRRCVKAWLGNLSHIHLEPQIHVPEQEILDAREALLMPEPIVLHVKDTRNALERCFLVMERQRFQESRLLEDGSAILSFHYYRFEESDLLRQLLYLGPAVELKSPPALRKALLERVDRALDNFSNASDVS